ncbi:Egfem1 [Phodopus roborovskii]|uniref:Egfem1 protein n=1 Tax=Phodopus roborovskii TaxID=109678 RepID=A0AAU9Z914_PHORO|nr:Egfem1 [Phodopus roborovskii]
MWYMYTMEYYPPLCPLVGLPTVGAGLSCTLCLALGNLFPHTGLTCPALIQEKYFHMVASYCRVGLDLCSLQSLYADSSLLLPRILLRNRKIEKKNLLQSGSLIGRDKTDTCAGGNGCAHLCQSENGVARCACHAGYQLSEDKKACEDINECVEELTPCAHRCVNSEGSFTCACHPGFELGADGKHCYRIELEIVNICEKNNGGCSHHCEPAIGGPHCSCNHGHQLDTDEKTCIDFDECESGDACCAQLCINYSGGYECSCQEGFQISLDGCGCDDDEQLEEEEEVLDILRFPGLLVQSSPQPFPYHAPSLTTSYEDENSYEEDQEAAGEFQGLSALKRVVCLDGTFGLDCSLSCEDCMNGGRCQEGESGCLCPEGWNGILCNESSTLTTGDQQAPLGCLKGFFGKNCKRKCHCANNGHCHRVYGACICDLGRYGRFCHLSCPRGTYGAGCSLECQCVEENTLDCNAKNGSCTCKSGYQGNRCQEAASFLARVKENDHTA